MEFRSTSGSSRTLAVAAVAACVLQVALAPLLSILGGRFNFMAALACAVALRGDGQRAAVTGFLAGLFYDLTGPVPVGLMSLLLTAASFALSRVAGPGQGGLSAVSVQFAAVFSVAVCLLNGIGMLALGAEGDVVQALLCHGIASAMLTTLAAVPFIMVLGADDATRGGFGSARSRRGGKRFKGIG